MGKRVEVETVFVPGKKATVTLTDDCSVAALIAKLKAEGTDFSVHPFGTDVKIKEETVEESRILEGGELVVFLGKIKA